MLYHAREKGQGLVEYALILVLVAVVVSVRPSVTYSRTYSQTSSHLRYDAREAHRPIQARRASLQLWRLQGRRGAYAAIPLST
jgi:hypothetical protein